MIDNKHDFDQTMNFYKSISSLTDREINIIWNYFLNSTDSDTLEKNLNSDSNLNVNNLTVKFLKGLYESYQR